MVSEDLFWIGDALIDPATRQVGRGHRRRRLSPKAMQVLLALVAARGRVLSRAALLDAAWPEVTVGEEVLTHAIAEIRKTLRDDSRRPRHIETVHKSGYRLLSPPRPAAALREAMTGFAAVAGTEGPSYLAERRPGPSARETPEGDEAFDLEGYALYLTASSLFERGGRKNLQAAAELFSHLVETKPRYGPGHAGLARTLTFIDLYFGPAGDGRSRALAHCETALRIDPASAEAHAARGLVLAGAGDPRRARRSFGAAIRLRTGAADTHLLLGHAGFAWGDFALSAAMLEQAARLQPDDFHSLVLAAKARRGLGDREGARANAAKAKARIDAHLHADPQDFRALCGRARASLELGARDDALALLQPLLQHEDPMHYYLASFLAQVGELPAALERLELIVESGWRNPGLLRSDPELDALRREPRYRRLEQSLGAG